MADRGRGSRLVVGVAAVLLGTAHGTAGAAELAATPSLTLQGERTSNLRNVSGGSSTEYVFRATPAATFALVTQSGSANVSGGMDFEWYERSEEVRSDRVAAYASLNVPGGFKATPRLSVEPSFRFVESNDALRRNEVTAIPVEDLAPSENLVTERTTTRQYEGALSMTWLATPNTELTLGGGAVKREFPGGPPTLVGSRTIQGNGSIGWKAAPRLWLGLYLDTAHDYFDQGPVSPLPKTRTYTAALSGKYELAPGSGLEVRGGATYAVNRTGLEERKDDQWVPYGRLSLTYASRRVSTTLFSSYEVAGAGSAGKTTKRGTVALSLTGQLAEKWAADLSGSYQANRSIGDIVTGVTVNEDGTTQHFATEDVETASGTAGIRYQPFRWASLRLSGSLVRQWSNGLVGSDLRRDSIALGVTVQDTYALLKRR